MEIYREIQREIYRMIEYKYILKIKFIKIKEKDIHLTGEITVENFQWLIPFH